MNRFVSKVGLSVLILSQLLLQTSHAQVKVQINFGDDPANTFLVSAGNNPSSTVSDKIGSCTGSLCGSGGSWFKSPNADSGQKGLGASVFENETGGPRGAAGGFNRDVILASRPENSNSAFTRWKDIMGYGAGVGGSGAGGPGSPGLPAYTPLARDPVYLMLAMRIEIEKVVQQTETNSLEYQNRLTGLINKLASDLDQKQYATLEISELSPTIPLSVENARAFATTLFNSVYSQFPLTGPLHGQMLNFYTAKTLAAWASKNESLYLAQSNEEKSASEKLVVPILRDARAGVPYFSDLKMNLDNQFNELAQDAKAQARLSIRHEGSAFSFAKQEIHQRMAQAENYLDADHPFADTHYEDQYKLWKSPYGAFLESLQKTHKTLVESKPASLQGIKARRAGLSLVDEADAAFAAGERANAEKLKSLAIGFADIASGALPIVGDVRDAYEAISGTDLINGEELASWERGLRVASVFTAVATFGSSSVAKSLVKGFGKSFTNVLRRYSGHSLGPAKAVINSFNKLFSPKVASKLPWLPWSTVPKAVLNGKEYGKIGDRLYTRHAIDRMVPRNLTIVSAGKDYGTSYSRGIPPSVIEHAIQNGLKSADKASANRFVHVFENVEVVTEGPAAQIVITVIRK